MGMSYSGPIPPPDMLAGLNAVIPNGAERVLAMAERQEAHRHQLEDRHQAGQSRRSWGGLLAGFLVAMAFLYASYNLILAGFGIYGTVLGGTVVVGLVSVFVVGTTSQRNERQSRVDKLLGRKQ